MRFCLDTNCLIWCVKRTGAHVDDAAEFLAGAAKAGHELIVPAVVAHEMLIRGRDDQRAAWLYELQSSFIVAAFDLGAAELASRLEAAYRRPAEANRYKDRFDIQVVATALRYGADAILSYDPDVRRIGAGHIQVRGFDEPGTLFAEEN